MVIGWWRKRRDRSHVPWRHDYDPVCPGCRFKGVQKANTICLSLVEDQ